MILKKRIIIYISIILHLSIVESNDPEDLSLDAKARVMFLQSRNEKYLVNGVIAWKLKKGEPQPLLRDDFENRSEGECFIVLQTFKLDLFYWCKGVNSNSIRCGRQLDLSTAEYTMRLSMQIHQKVHYSIQTATYESQKFRFYFLNSPRIVNEHKSKMFLLSKNTEKGDICIKKESVNIQWIQVDLCLVVPYLERRNVYAFCGKHVDNNSKLKEASTNLCNRMSSELNLQCILITEYGAPELTENLPEFHQIFKFDNHLPTWKILDLHNFSQHRPMDNSICKNAPYLLLKVTTEATERFFPITIYSYERPLFKYMLNSDGCAILYVYYVTGIYESLFLWIGRKANRDTRIICARALMYTMNNLTKQSEVFNIRKASVIEEEDEPVNFQIHFQDFLVK